MTSRNLYRSLGGLDPNLIAAAAPTDGKTRQGRPSWIKWASIAAGLCVLIGIAFRIALAFVPSQTTDPFREGSQLIIQAEEELPAQYDGNLLAFRLDFPEYELYYKQDGHGENPADWFSLLAMKGDENSQITLHCLFGDSGVEDWKVRSVFTSEATQRIHVNGVEVLVARLDFSLQFEYWYYALFEYDDVVYDVRVKSNDPEYVYRVLHELLAP